MPKHIENMLMQLVVNVTLLLFIMLAMEFHDRTVGTIPIRPATPAESQAKDARDLIEMLRIQQAINEGRINEYGATEYENPDM